MVTISLLPILLTIAAGVDTKPGFRLIGPAAPSDIIPVLFAVTQKNVHELERMLLAVSDPDSSQYGEHLSADKVHTLTANPGGTRSVIEWLIENGYTQVVPTRTGDYVRAKGTVEIVESTLGAQMGLYAHPEKNSGVVVTRTEQWKIPRALHAHVDFVGYINDFATPSRLRYAPVIRHGAYPGGNTTISVINKQYAVPDNRVRPQGGSTQGVLSIGQNFDKKDLVAWAKMFGVPAPLSNISVTGEPNFSAGMRMFVSPICAACTLSLESSPRGTAAANRLTCT